jgi:hypothetical protein
MQWAYGILTSSEKVRALRKVSLPPSFGERLRDDNRLEFWRIRRRAVMGR